MNESIVVLVNGQAIDVVSGSTVAVALLEANAFSRISVSGESRQPLCGMGVCYECRASVNGLLHQRTCQILCQPGMKIVTE